MVHLRLIFSKALFFLALKATAFPNKPKLVELNCPEELKSTYLKLGMSPKH